ncbi:MAG TPA: TIM-barrel domain-containing protein [Pyrinomonadaceae bacterium]
MRSLLIRRRVACAAALLCCLFVPAAGAWRGAGHVVAVARQTDGVVLTLSSGARVAVTLHDLQVARVRLAPTGTFARDFSYAVESRDRKTVAAVVRETAGALEITTRDVPGARIRVNRRPFLISVYDAAGNLVVEDDPTRPVSFDLADGAVEATKRRDPFEFYYGFGEKATGEARHNQAFAMWNTDTYAYPAGLDPIYESIPFFVALRQGKAYGLFFDNTYRTHFDMGRSDPRRYTFGAPGGELNYYVFTGGPARTPKEVLREYTELTGRTPLPPLWALGYQQSRYSYFPESKVREVARGFRERHIPADVIYFDIDYMDGFRIFTWDKQKFPDPPRLLADLRAQGLRTVVIIDPGIKVDDTYPAYREGRAQGFFCQAADGSEFHAKVWPGLCAFPDFTNPRTRAWFGALYRQNLDDGISGFWNDMNEPATFPPEKNPPQPNLAHDPAKTFPLDVRHAGDGQPGTHARYHNVYGMQMARATFEGVQQLRTDARPFVLTRAGYAGVQRYSAVWTGDNVPSWEHLALSVPMLTNLSVSGVPFVGADVGGFAGSTTPELYARWLQAAALTPFCRTHSNNESAAREPWAFGDTYERINRASIELRYRLLPYLYTVFQEHTQNGVPVMRPLWFNYPADYAVYDPPLALGEFLVGDDLLVAPVLEPGATARPVYFPRGDAWLDWWTGARYEGGTATLVPAPLERLPLFVRVGAVVPVQPVVQHTGEMARAPFGLVVATGAQAAAGRFYEDAGEGYDYRRGTVRVTNSTLRGNALRFSRGGTFADARTLGAVEFLGLSERPKGVLIGGRDAREVSFDRDTRRLRVHLSPAEAAEVHEIVLVP